MCRLVVALMVACACAAPTMDDCLQSPGATPETCEVMAAEGGFVEQTPEAGAKFIQFKEGLMEKKEAVVGDLLCESMEGRYDVGNNQILHITVSGATMTFTYPGGEVGSGSFNAQCIGTALFPGSSEKYSFTYTAERGEVDWLIGSNHIKWLKAPTHFDLEAGSEEVDEEEGEEEGAKGEEEEGEEEEAGSEEVDKKEGEEEGAKGEEEEGEEEEGEEEEGEEEGAKGEEEEGEEEDGEVEEPETITNTNAEAGCASQSRMQKWTTKKCKRKCNKSTSQSKKYCKEKKGTCGFHCTSACKCNRR